VVSQTTANPTVLLAEDDLALASMLVDDLEEAGYRVWQAGNAAEAELLADEVQPDLVVLDLILPDGSGLVLCAKLRARLGAPIIVCSASRREEDVVLSLKLGADDFLRKPIRLPELVARMERALRRGGTWSTTAGVHAGAPSAIARPPPPRQQRIGELVVDPARREVRVGEQPLPLTPTEYRLLCALAARVDEVVGREELAELIWGQHDPGTDEALAVHMRRLRAKLDLGAPDGPSVTTMRGFGYRLSVR
jgi:DNA-binding response OmpR family regulator